MSAPRVALCGNPNVGKSTVFNALTGLRQHTGNWAGKTVESAWGKVRDRRGDWVLVDLPGAYSLLRGSPEEDVAGDELNFSTPDAAVVVCDATCLERGLNLALQAAQVCGRTVVCVNMMDEAERRGLSVDLKRLEALLGLPVVGVSARKGQGLDALRRRVDEALRSPGRVREARLPQPLEEARRTLAESLPLAPHQARFAALRMLAAGPEGARRLSARLSGAQALGARAEEALASLKARGWPPERVVDAVIAQGYREAEALCAQTVRRPARPDAERRQLRLDRLLASRRLGIPAMLALLALVLYLTLSGANVPSEWLSATLLGFEPTLAAAVEGLGAPAWLVGMLCQGAYRVTAWVVSVMLPPMAIFFPLFTLLEDLGFLPRVAFNLDRCFQRCRACGKQALCMWAGPRKRRFARAPKPNLHASAGMHPDSLHMRFQQRPAQLALGGEAGGGSDLRIDKGAEPVVADEVMGAAAVAALLVGPAAEVVHAFAPGAGGRSGHGALAVGAEGVAGKQVGKPGGALRPAAGAKRLNGLKGLAGDQGFVRVFVDDPGLRRVLAHRAAFVGRFGLAVVNHVAHIGAVAADFGHARSRPAAFRRRAAQAQGAVSQGRRNALVVERPGHLAGQSAAGELAENAPHHLGAVRVRRQAVFVPGILGVAVGRERPHKLPRLHLGAQRPSDFAAGVAGVLLVGDVHPRRGGGGEFVFAVVAVQHRQVAHPSGRKIFLLIVAGLGIVAPQAREILGHHGVDAAPFDIGDHALKPGAAKVGAGKAVVHIHLLHPDSAPLRLLRQQPPLVVDGAGLILPAILFRQAQVQPGSRRFPSCAHAPHLHPTLCLPTPKAFNEGLTSDKSCTIIYIC